MAGKVVLVVLTVFTALAVCSCGGNSVGQPDIIHIAVPYNPDSLDPHRKDLVGHFAVASQFYEPLVKLDAGMKIQSCLAQSWENPDPYTWIFHLQPGVKFHKGSALTSADVVYSFERLKRDPKLEMRAYLAGVTEITAPGTQTVRIKTDQPLNVFLNKLSFVHIVPEGSRVPDLTLVENGTGPYSLLSWEQGQIIRMARNENYWGPKPSLRQAYLYLNRTPAEATEDLPSKKFQLIQFDSKELEAALAETKQYEMIRNNTFFVTYLGFDLEREETPYCNIRPNPFLKLDVRRAIQSAIDQKELIAKIPLYASPATQPLPPFVFGFNPGIPLPVHDLSLARKLMKKAGHVDGFEVTLLSTRSHEPAALVLRDQLRKIGVSVNINAMPSPDYYRALESREVSFFISSFGCVSGDASDYLEGALHSTDASHRYGGSNFTHYSNPTIDRLIEEAGMTQMQEERRRKTHQVLKLAMEDLPWIPLYIDQEMYALDQRFSWQPRGDGFIFAYEINLRNPGQ